jgi:hypothetical protein
MNYLLLICSDGVPSTEKAAAMQESIPGWLEETDRRGVRLFGHQLTHPSEATTVRVRGSKTFVTDGPFAETKEFVAGFDLIDAADLDEAIEIAAKHPVSWFHTVEIRPLPDGSDTRAQLDGGALANGSGAQRYAMFMCVDGVPATDQEEEWVHSESKTWFDTVTERDPHAFGTPLQGASTATTVQVRDGQTLVSDGPFAETKEFIGGFVVTEAANQEEAVALAATHPLAAFHQVEVRAFAADE